MRESAYNTIYLLIIAFVVVVILAYIIFADGFSLTDRVMIELGS
jgi:hypothetical protein